MCKIKAVGPGISSEVLPFRHPAIKHINPNDLKLPARRLRVHTKAAHRKLAATIRAVGFIDPVVTDGSGKVLSGTLRVEVACRLGLEAIPVVQIDHMSEIEKRIYVLAANRIAEDAGWDRSLLVAELGELAIHLPRENIELEASGFSIAEYDRVNLDSGRLSTEEPEPEVPEVGPVVTRPGDLWRCGHSRLLCADALRSASYLALMAGQRATMTFTDPPYNVSIRKHARGNSKAVHREFAMASGELTNAEFLGFLKKVFALIADASVNGSIVFACIDWSHIQIMLEAGHDAFAELKNICVWVKSNGGMGTFYRSRHELVCVFKVGVGAHINTFELGQHGRSRTNVWEYGGLNAFRSGRNDELSMHPTVKPVRMIADAMLDCSKPGSIVLDPFTGSGSTLLAGEMVGRHVYGIELDPQYVDVAVRRWQTFTRRDAILDSTGQTFDEVQAERDRAATLSPEKRASVRELRHD